MNKKRTEPTQTMSRRDEFAKAAMQAEISSDQGSIKQAAKELGITPNEYNPEMHFPRLVAKRAVRFADALILELGGDL